MSTFKTIRRILAVAILSMVVIMPADAKKAKAPQAPKYVFYFIGDGMGINQVRGAEIFNEATGIGPKEINFFHFPVRTFVTTHSASSLVTDSSAAGTALATGVKTENGAMGIDAQGNSVSNLTEWAHFKGFGTGVATSVGVNHATPAAFYAHTKSRNDYETIANQLIAADNVNFAAGGGIINEVKKTGHDSKYLEQKAKEAGITVLHGKKQFNNLATMDGRVICLSADYTATDLALKIDQKEGDTKLAEFVDAGIDYLYGHFAKKGFFFMIEGGSIDHAGHDDDGASDFIEVNDLAEAIDRALAFYEQHPDETLIVVTADHETGALMLGSGQYAMSPALLANQKQGESALNAKFKELTADGKTPSWDDVKNFFKENLGLWGTVKVDPRTEASFKEMYDRQFGQKTDDKVVTLYSSGSRFVSEAIDYLNKQAGYNWAHGTHTGSPLGLYAKGAVAAEFLKCTDNTDIPVMIRTVAKY